MAWTDLPQYIGSILLAPLGIVGGVAATLDWMLLERQKKQLRGTAESAWIWLDDHRKISLRGLMHSSIGRIVTMSAACFVALFISLLMFYDASNVMSAATGDHLYDLINQGEVRKYQNQTRGLALGLIFYAPYIWWIQPAVFRMERSDVRSDRTKIAWIMIISYIVLRSLPKPEVVRIGLMPTQWDDYSDFFAHALFSTILAAPFATILLQALIKPLWFMAASLFIFLIKSSSFIMLRVASYEKGPLFAISALCIAAGGVLKFIAAK